MTQRVPLPYGFAGAAGYDGYYHHSGQINFAGVMGSIIIGLITAVALAWVYVLTDLYIPIVQLNAFACAGFGAALGAAPALVMRQLKVRNVPVTLAVVGLVSIVAYYLTWAAWEYMILRHGTVVPTFLHLAEHPQLLLRIAMRVREVGTWKMSEHDTDNIVGWPLTIFWLIEAATIFGVAFLTSFALVGDRPFCEKCDQWCSGPSVIRTTGAADPLTLREHLQARDFAFLSTLGPKSDSGGLDFRLHRCSKCGDLNTLTVTSVKITRDKKGRAHSKGKRIINKLLLSPAEVQQIAPPPPATSAAPPASPQNV